MCADTSESLIRLQSGRWLGLLCIKSWLGGLLPAILVVLFSETSSAHSMGLSTGLFTTWLPTEPVVLRRRCIGKERTPKMEAAVSHSAWKWCTITFVVYCWSHRQPWHNLVGGIHNGMITGKWGSLGIILEHATTQYSFPSFKEIFIIYLRYAFIKHKNQTLPKKFKWRVKLFLMPHFRSGAHR